MKINKLLLTFIAFVSAGAFAGNISKIEYVGCQRIEAETIESYLPIQVGDEFDDNSINEALKTLNNTGFFEDVKIEMKGTTLIVNVKEFPMINKISFEGNSKLSDKDIEKAIRIKSRETLSPAKIKEIQQGLLEAYRRMGRYNASVNPKIIKLDNNRVNLVFEINEGNAAGIERIVFVGNEKVSSSELRDVIYSKVKRWYRFFVTDDIYDQERLQEDKMAIVKYYHDNGYANAKVLSGVAELSANKRGFVLTFAVDEGDLYKFGNVSVKSHINKLSDKDLIDDFYCKKGEKFSSTLLEIDNAMIAKKAGRKGFSSVKVEPDVTRDEKTKLVNILFNVTEGDKIYISKIIIKGNTRTKDHVIRREIPLEEGDAYNQALVSMAEGNLRGLGFFKVVNVETIPDPNSPDKCIIQVNVEETPTGEAMVAASYSTQDSFGLDLTYNERNFFGTGKTLSVFLGSNKSRSGRSYEIDANGEEKKRHRKDKFRFLNNITVTATDPHIFDKDIEGSISAYRYQSSKWDAFTTKEAGGTLGASYALSTKFSQSWEYTGASRKFDDVFDNATPIIKYQTMKKEGDGISASRTGKCGLSSIKHTISYGTQFLTGIRGSFRTGLSTTIAGIGGDARHMKNEIFNSYLMPISRKTSLKLGLSFGALSKIGGKTPHIADSFSMGLDTFRGFDDCGFGPFAETTREIKEKNLLGGTEKKCYTFRDYIGAKKYWKGTAEFAFPIGLPEELQFRGFVFSDIGTLWDAPEKGKTFLKETGKKYTMSDEKKTQIDEVTCAFDNGKDNKLVSHKIMDSKKIRASLGLGISLITPFGPMKFTYAFPIRKEKYDEPYRFLIGFTTTF